ncbi:MAG: preprotein translocase subunit SecG [Firmicutes bacterium]|nr:preprotein translocase subunit SecG [Bacillota bacterium]
MKVFLTVLYALICILLIAAVLLQSGRSAGLSGSIAGGAEALFGGKKKGLDEFFDRLTVGLAVVFGLLSLALVVWK